MYVYNKNILSISSRCLFQCVAHCNVSSVISNDFCSEYFSNLSTQFYREVTCTWFQRQLKEAIQINLLFNP